jgi:transketolase
MRRSRMADIYPTQKGYFKHYLYEEMANRKKIFLVLPDLGYGIFDKFITDFPDRVILCGAAEQAAIGIAVGLALDGKIPFVYSIPNFLIYRPFEFIRNYIDYEKIPVKLIAGGRGKSYTEDGYSHWCEDLKQVMSCFPNIKQLWPKDKSELPGMVSKMVNDKSPYMLSLERKI